VFASRAQIAYREVESMPDPPMTVVETARFLRDVRSIMSDSEREKLVTFVAANPASGEIVPRPAGFERCVGRWLGVVNVAARRGDNNSEPPAAIAIAIATTRDPRCSHRTGGL